jgi:hypothetical protein
MSDIRPDKLTQLSYENARAELIDRINAKRIAAGRPVIVDDHAANPHLIIVEVLSLYSEAQGTTIDNRTLACLLVMCRNLEDATIAAESIGYDWEGVAPAVVNVELDFGSGGHSKNIELSKGHKFLASPSYVLDEDTTILAGTEEVTLSLRQITERQNTVVSNGQKNQKYIMPDSPVVKGSAEVAVDGTPYRVVDYLFDLTAGEEGVQFRVDYEEKGNLETGDGINGVQITLGASIVTDYETSLGAAGRIAANTIDDTVDPILDIDSGPVTVTITQPVGSSGGLDRESLDSMKFNGPRSLRTLLASISRSDFQTNAEQVPGVLRALPLTTNEDASIAANTTLVLIAGEPSGAGETTLYNDDHDDGIIPAGEWTEISGTWTEAAGEMYGSAQTDVIELSAIKHGLPLELRVNAKALTTDPIQLIFKKDGSNDYLYATLESDGAGNTDFKLGQVLASVPTENTTSDSIDSQVLIDIILKYTLNDELVLNVGGTDVLTFNPDTSFRQKLWVRYKGEISVNITALVVLVDFPIPNQALLDDVLDYIREQRPTLVSHRVASGQMQFLPLNLDLEMTPLTGYTIAQVRASIETALDTFLSITRRDEDGEYSNQPGVSLSLDEIYDAMRGAIGLDRVRIFWPEAFDIVPDPREFILLGEIKWR